MHANLPASVRQKAHLGLCLCDVDVVFLVVVVQADAVPAREAGEPAQRHL